MKINFRNSVPDEIIESGIIMTCDEDMNLVISAEDYKRLETEFPSAFQDVYVIES